jgi:hypothetical protein
MNITKWISELSLMLYKHIKRGTVYTVIGTGEVQDASGLGIQEGDKASIYFGSDGKMWIRKTSEFLDGRFESLGQITQKEIKIHYRIDFFADDQWHHSDHEWYDISETEAIHRYNKICDEGGKNYQGCSYKLVEVVEKTLRILI